MSHSSLRFAIVGLGSIGRRHLVNLRSLGFHDIIAVRSRGFPVPELGESAALSTLQEALDREPDAVLVTNPTSLHLASAFDAIQHGCHVFVEKPLSHSLDGVDRLLALAQQRGLVGMVGYQMRFHPALQQVKRLLDQGAVGRAVSTRIEYGEYLPDWHPWENYRDGYSARRALGGGPVLTLSHTLDLAYWLFGYPERVTCLSERLSSLEVDTEDTAEMLLWYPAGPICSVHVDYVRRPPRRSLQLVGESGVLCWDDGSDQVEWYTGSEREPKIFRTDTEFTRNQMFLDELAHFISCIQRGERPLVTLEDGAHVLEIALAALASAEQQGAPVRPREMIPA